MALGRFVKRMVGVDYHGWLDIDNAQKVIEHLKQWLYARKENWRC
ncbi:phage protein GemA/Gp16 family protein [Neisseria flavescens]